MMIVMSRLSSESIGTEACWGYPYGGPLGPLKSL